MAGLILACVAEKGGVGKTTSAVNLAAAWGASRPVLLLDLDPQGSASRGLGLAPDGAALADALLGEGEIVAEETRWPGVRLVRGGPEVAGAAAQLAKRDDGAQQLAEQLARAAALAELVVVDCPPTLGVLSLGAMMAARWLLIPTACDGAAVWGVDNALATLDELHRAGASRARLLGILPTLYDARTAHAREVEEVIRARWGASVTLTTIRRDVRLAEALSAGEPITSWAPSGVAAQLYAQAARELLTRMEAP